MRKEKGEWGRRKGGVFKERRKVGIFKEERGAGGVWEHYLTCVGIK